MGNTWTRIFRTKDIRILLLGLDGVGKTTLLYRLKYGEYNQVLPTIGFNIETIQYKDLMFKAWDIGSRDKMRPLFRHYYKGSEAVVIVVDGGDSERLDELNYDVLKPALQSEELKHVPFLFLANKCDTDDHMTNQEITERLGLKHMQQSWNIFQVSALQNIGVPEALDWLASQLRDRLGRSTAAIRPESMESSINPVPSCSRAYTAFKCLFSKPGRSDKYHLPHEDSQSHFS